MAALKTQIFLKTPVANVFVPPSTSILRRISTQNLHPIETDGTRSLRHA
jgi:hypothetical protein